MSGIGEIFLNNIKPAADQVSSNVSNEGYEKLSSMKNGDTFSAKVISNSDGNVTLRMPGGNIINARLSSDMVLTEGQTVSFEVKNSGSSISLSPLLTNTSTDVNVLKALNMASLPVTDVTVDMTSKMMQAGVSVNKDSLLSMYENIRSNPGADASDVIDLNKLGLEINNENLKNIDAYKNLSYQIDRGMQEIAEKTDQALLDLVKGGESENALKLMDSVMDAALSFMPENEDEIPEDLKQLVENLSDGDPDAHAGAEKPDSSLSQDMQTDLPGGKSAPLSVSYDSLPGSIQGEEVISSQKPDESVISDPASKALQLLKMMQDGGGQTKQEESTTVRNDNSAGDAEAVLPGDKGVSSSSASQISDLQQSDIQHSFDRTVSLYREITGKSDYKPANVYELLKDISELSGKDRSAFLGSDDSRRLVFEVLKNQWNITPSEVADKEKVESLYKRLTSQISTISDGLVSVGMQNSPANNAANNMNSNIDFLNQLNQMYAYIQLPLKLSGGDNAHGDLYVYSNRKNLSSDDSNVTAFLHLDMDNLGPVDVYVSMDVRAGGKVSTRFTVADDETLDLLNDHMDMLTERLKKRGYDLNCTMGIKGEEKSPEEDALDKGGVNLLLLRQTGGGSLNLTGTRSFDVRA